MEEMLTDRFFKPTLRGALRLLRRVINEGPPALRELYATSHALSSLEQSFANFLEDATPARGLRLRVFVQGKPWGLAPAIQQQLFLIGREAVVNALRHSEATKIEVELQYFRRLLRVFVRDNGRGINPERVQKAADSHWGLRRMRGRADNIGAQFSIWTRPGTGTEVRVVVPSDAVTAPGN